MRTKEKANYRINRTPENRRIYIEQQVSWFYADLLKAQHGMQGPLADRTYYWHARAMRALANLDEAHARLAALTEDPR